MPRSVRRPLQLVAESEPFALTSRTGLRLLKYRGEDGGVVHALQRLKSAVTTSGDPAWIGGQVLYWKADEGPAPASGIEALARAAPAFFQDGPTHG